MLVLFLLVILVGCFRGFWGEFLFRLLRVVVFIFLGIHFCTDLVFRFNALLILGTLCLGTSVFVCGFTLPVRVFRNVVYVEG